MFCKFIYFLACKQLDIFLINGKPQSLSVWSQTKRLKILRKSQSWKRKSQILRYFYHSIFEVSATKRHTSECT